MGKLERIDRVFLLGWRQGLTKTTSPTKKVIKIAGKDLTLAVLCARVLLRRLSVGIALLEVSNITPLQLCCAPAVPWALRTVGYGM